MKHDMLGKELDHVGCEMLGKGLDHLGEGARWDLGEEEERRGGSGLRV